MLDDEKCLCGSGRLYSMCCKPFSGQGIAVSYTHLTLPTT